MGIDAEFVSLAPAVKEPNPEVSLFLFSYGRLV